LQNYAPLICCHFDPFDAGSSIRAQDKLREKSDLQKQVILSKAKDLFEHGKIPHNVRDNALHWISQSLHSFEMTHVFLQFGTSYRENYPAKMVWNCLLHPVNGG
jgi:hypothetical protein